MISRSFLTHLCSRMKQIPPNDSTGIPRASAPSGRLDALDALRAVMMLLGVVLHVSLVYNSWKPGPGWAFKDTSNAWPVLDAVWFFVHPFRLPLFYLSAGYLGALLVAKRGWVGFWHNRIRRIGYPFLVFTALLSPAVVAASVFSFRALGGDPDPWGRVVSVFTSDRWLPVRHVLGMTRLNGVSAVGPGFHLWFLYDLMGYALLAVALHVAVRRLSASSPRGAAVFARIRQTFSAGLAAAMARPTVRTLVLTALYGSLLFATEQLGVPTPRVPSGWFVITDASAWIPFLVYGGYFALGWSFFGAPLWSHMSRNPGWQLVLGGVLHVLLQVSGGPKGWHAEWPTYFLEAASTVLLVFGLLAFFLAYVNRPSSALRYLLDASYWVYLIHMPLVCVLPGLLGPDAWWTGTKFAAVLVLTYGLSLASYALFVRGKALGRFLGERAGS